MTGTKPGEMGLQLLETTMRRAQDLAPAVDYWTVRVVAEESEALSVRQGIVEPTRIETGRGAMVTVVRGAGMGYAATSDLGADGLRAAFARATGWAELHASLGLFDAALFPRSPVRSDYRTGIIEPWEARSTEDKLVLLRDACTALKIDERIVDWSAWIEYSRVSQLLATSDARSRCLST